MLWSWSRFDARYWMLGAGALGRPRGMECGGSFFGCGRKPLFPSTFAGGLKELLRSTKYGGFSLTTCRWGYQPSHKGSPENKGVGSLSLLQAIFEPRDAAREAP